MLLTSLRLKELQRATDTARRTFFCPNTTPGTERFVAKPAAAAEVGFHYPNGDVLEEQDAEGVKMKGIQLPAPQHGNAYLAVDPETGIAECAACADQKALVEDSVTVATRNVSLKVGA